MSTTTPPLTLAWLLEPVQNKKQMMAMMSAYHRNIIRPEYNNLVLQLESALKTTDDKVFAAKREWSGWLRKTDRPRSITWASKSSPVALPCVLSSHSSHKGLAQLHEARAKALHVELDVFDHI